MKFLKILIANHLRVGNLSCGKIITKKAISRFVFDIKNDCVGVLILSLADRLAARGKMVTNKVIAKHIEVTKKILDAYQKSLITANLPKLISGIDLIEKLGLKEVLIDEVSARAAARLLDLTPRGTLFILLKALQKEEIDQEEFLEVLNQLLNEGFRLKEEVYLEALKEAKKIATKTKPVT